MAIGGSSAPAGAGSTSVQLLEAARQLLGGEDRLAEQLKMSRLLLRWYMAGRDEMPSHLVLKVVDLLLEARESQSPLHEHAARPASGNADGADVPA
jgi:hypothetical protein